MQDVAPLPNLDKLLALLERYLALPGEPGLPEGTMTEEEQAQLLKDCPDAQPVGPGPWLTSSPAPSPQLPFVAAPYAPASDLLAALALLGLSFSPAPCPPTWLLVSWAPKIVRPRTYLRHSHLR
ncbi:hypothetical protein MRS44_006875 [Fusarium solani]|uniref:uncharacterized protein n=1 Tax=Fusarium solani TaxID=169388 RepID=UPI0032C40C07|nr:hypothetical protein MRS44_006875 [Fusarium solani]